MFRVKTLMQKCTGAAAVAVAVLAIGAGPARAIDGEILINQAKVNAGGITPGDTAGFPATLSKPGRYKLTGNLTVPSSDGIEVSTDDVTIDLNGFTISATGSSAIGIHAASGVDRMRVMNGTITGFTTYGILGVGTNFVVEDMRVVGNSTGMQLGTEGRVRNSTVANNTAIGIRCYQCLIEGNILTGNANGVFDSNAGGGVVLGNVIVGNAGYGIVAPDPPLPKTGYGNNILAGNNSGGLQALGVTQMHPNLCDPACP